MGTGLFVEMVWRECWVCGVAFGISRSYETSARRDGTVIFCVRGCRLGLGESDESKLRKQLDAKNAELVRKNTDLLLAQARVTAAQREAAKFKCPHCPRRYVGKGTLLRHIRDHHETPLRLASNAGPDAHNTKVN